MTTTTIETITLDGYCWQCKIHTPHLVWLEPDYDNKCTICEARHCYAADGEQDCIDTFNDCETCDQYYWSQTHPDFCTGADCACHEGEQEREHDDSHWDNLGMPLNVSMDDLIHRKWWQGCTLEEHKEEKK